MSEVVRAQEYLTPFVPAMKIKPQPDSLASFRMVRASAPTVRSWTLYFDEHGQGQTEPRSVATDSSVIVKDVALASAAESDVVAPVYRWSWFVLLLLSLAAGIAVGASLFAGVGLDLLSAAVVTGAIPVLGATLFAIGGKRHRAGVKPKTSTYTVRHIIRPGRAVRYRHRHTKR